jgi:ubiquinone/menaquinone biosynthesis C-methylase UbiE
LFAWITARGTDTTNRLLGDHKRQLFADLSGNVLEIGPGAGANLPYLPPGLRWIGIEPNPFMHPYLKEKAERLGLTVDLRMGSAERLQVDDNSVDVVVSTLVLCSVGDVTDVLREVQRVLRPGGRFVFIEHVAAPPKTFLRLAQQVVRPVWQRIADGCTPDRETWVTLEHAGFSTLTYDRFELSIPLKIVAPAIAGIATKY